jgi:hypothetical protein
MKHHSSPALRPPFPLFHELDRPGIHDERIRPALCALQVACHVLKVSVECRFTASCLLHRFVAVQVVSIDQDEWQWITMACLFLAGKVEEEPRRLRDAINCASMITIPAQVLNGQETIGDSTQTHEELKTINENLGSFKKVQVQWNSSPPELDDAYWDAKRRIVEKEQFVLRWLAFDVSVSHPHRGVAAIVDHLVDCSPHWFGIVTPEQLVHQAWTHCNDALFSSQALSYPVMTLACAAVSITLRDRNIEESMEEQDWWKHFAVPKGELETLKTRLLAIRDKLVEHRNR